MIFKTELLEEVLSKREADEIIFLDNCSLLDRGKEKELVNGIYHSLRNNSHWFVTPLVRKEYKVGVDTLEARAKKVRRDPKYQGREHHQIFEGNYSKESLQARERVLSLLGKEVHNPFSEQNITSQIQREYRDLVPKVRDCFSEIAGEVHPTDVDLVSVGLAYALSGRKVIMSSADKNLLKTFCEGSRALSWRLQYGPKITVCAKDGLFDYAHLSYKR
jgi:hypothetical protein